jgi:hypothetical protein
VKVTTEESSRALTASPKVNFPPASPEKGRQAKRPEFSRQPSSSLRRRSTQIGDIDQPIHTTSRSIDDDVSFDGSFKTFASDNVQSAHQRTSTVRSSKFRRGRTLGAVADDDNSNENGPPNRKGSQSLHVSSSVFDFDGAENTNFFSSKPLVSSPSKSSDKTKFFSHMETPAVSKSPLSVSSPAGVDEFPDTPESPFGKRDLPETPRADIGEKYKREVERTAARLERLRLSRIRNSSEGQAELRVAFR